jgi:hypothetical protein
METENKNTDSEHTERFRVVAERAYFWNFIVNVAIVFILLLINTYKPNNNSIANDTLVIILNFMQSTTYIFAGTYILKFLGSDGKNLLSKIGNVKNFFTDKDKPRSKK